MSEYKGIRWLKCDLHVHTPEDNRHWLDDELKLGEPRRPRTEGQCDESGIQEKARHFLRRCHELNLQVIGVTDHNLTTKTDPRDWFLVHLVEQNRSVARDMGRKPLYIFPGFEINIGFHVVCLFAPARKQADIECINTILTKLGLPKDSRFGESGPELLRRNSQNVSLKKLVEIVQGEDGGIVIAAHADQKDGIFEKNSYNKDYQHPELYCIELTQNPPSSKHRDILAGGKAHWQRDKQPAWLMSSDAKSLKTDENGLPPANSVGYRYTWIKMSEPSIESLRQAFLDHESRIMVSTDITSDVNPESRQKHARILSVSIHDAEFLEDQTITLSPNLNCIIGGRGSGKSTIFEGVRLALGKEDDLKADNRTKEKIGRAKELLIKNLKTEVKVRWRSRDGVEDALVFSPADMGCRIDGRTVADLPAYLKGIAAQFFSQQQLNRMTEKSGNLLLFLLDDFIREDLDHLEAREREIRSSINQLFAAKETLALVEKEVSRLKQEMEELDRQWNARASLQEEARKHQGAQAASSYVDKIMEAVEEDSVRLSQDAADIVEGHSPPGSQVERWPEGSWFEDLDNKVLAARENLQAEVEAAVSKYRQTINALFDKDERWPSIRAGLDTADERFIAACQEKGIDPEDVSRIQEINQQRQVKKQELEIKTQEKNRLAEQTRKIGEMFTNLHDVWMKMHQCRRDMVQKVNEAARTETRNVINVTVDYFADEGHFEGIWNSLYSDRRTRLGRNWEEVGTEFFKHFRSRMTEAGESAMHPVPVWEMIQKWLDAPDTIPDDVKESIGRLNLSFEEIALQLTVNSRKQWETARTTCVSDRVDMVLFRPDGTKAGSISDGTLSDGQRNTAALAMLLAQGDFPLLLDQPEDELDSNFIYRELVPMIRRLKNRRQIILVTHNANLPVNEDAELVYALETRDGHGKRLAEGGLDQETVANAVLEIMEGSEEAFKRRREKYHF